MSKQKYLKLGKKPNPKGLITSLWIFIQFLNFRELLENSFFHIQCVEIEMETIEIRMTLTDGQFATLATFLAGEDNLTEAKQSNCGYLQPFAKLMKCKRRTMNLEVTVVCTTSFTIERRMSYGNINETYEVPSSMLERLMTAVGLFPTAE